MRIFPVDDNLSDRLNELATSYGRLAAVRIPAPNPTDQSPQGGFEVNTILYICTAFHDGARRTGIDRRRPMILAKTEFVKLASASQASLRRWRGDDSVLKQRRGFDRSRSSMVKRWSDARGECPIRARHDTMLPWLTAQYPVIACRDIGYRMTKSNHHFNNT